MRMIRTALAVMGALIVAGFIFLCYVLYQRMTGVGYFAKPHLEATPTDIAAAALGHAVLLPDGSAIATALHLGNDAQVVAIHDIGSRIMLLIRQPKVGDRLYLLEPRTGTVVSAIGIGDSVPPLPGAATPPAAPAATAPAAPAPVQVAPAPAAATPATKPQAPNTPAPPAPTSKPALH